MMLVREGLADYYRVISLQVGVNVGCAAPGQERRLAKWLHRVKIGRAQSRGQALVAELVRSKAIEAGDARKFRELVGEVIWNRRMLVGGRISSRPQIQIRLQLIGHPGRNRLAGAADHDSDRRH